MLKKSISLLLTIVMVFSMFTAIPTFVSAASTDADEIAVNQITELVESGTDNFPYDDSDIYVADSIINGIIDKQGVPTASSEMSIALSHKCFYRDVAEALIDDDMRITNSLLWQSLRNVLNGDAWDNVTFNKDMYTLVILDYLKYETETPEYKSNLLKLSQKFFLSLVSLVGSEYIGQTVTDDYYSKIDNVIANQSLTDAIQLSKKYNILQKLNKYSGLIDDIETVSTSGHEYYQNVSRCLAVQQANEERINFLIEMKNANADDTDFSAALDNVINWYQESYGSIAFNSSIPVMINAGLSMAFDTALVECSPEIAFYVQLLRTGSETLNWLFNSDDISENNIKLTIIYILSSYAYNAIRGLRDSYVSDKTPENAQAFIGGYQSYLNFQKFASNCLYSFFSASMFDGVYNKIFSDSAQATYAVFQERIHSDITFCEHLETLIRKHYDLYFIFSGFESNVLQDKILDDPTIIDDNSNIPPELLDNYFCSGQVKLCKAIALSSNLTIFSDFHLNSTIELNGCVFTCKGNLYLENCTIKGSGSKGKIIVEKNLYTDFNGASTITISEGSDVTVLGNANLSNTFVWGDKTLLIEQGASLSVGKNVSISGTQWNMKRFIVTNRGNLIVNGDFQTLGYSDFIMDSDSAHMMILGTYVNGTSGITAGTVELKGNCSNIKTTGTGTVRISGYSKQTISNYDIANLIIENQSEEGAEFSTGTVRGKLKAVNAHIVNGKNICLFGGEFDGDTYSGDISIAGNTTLTKNITIEGDLYTEYNGGATITVSNNSHIKVLGNANFSNNYVWGSKTLQIEPGATLTVEKNLSFSGTSWNMQYFIIINRGNLIVGGDFQPLGYSSFSMDNDNAYLKVSGNNSYGIGIIAGTLVLKGNCSNINASGNSKVYISGDTPQTISQKSYFSNLIIENSNGVSFNNPITVYTLFNHQGNPFTLYNNGSGSSFVDYDGDGLKDNIDPNPIVGNPCTLYFAANNDEYGSVSESVIETCGGKTINVTATPQSKYYFSKWIDQSGNAVSNNIKYEFVAKTDNHYTAVFEKRKRNITWDCSNGWIVVPNEAPIESEVSVSCYPYDGYVFEEGSLKYNDIPIENGTFIMPDEDVFLTANFIRNENYFRLLDKLQEAWQYDSTYYTTDSFNVLVDTISAAQNALVNDISEETSSVQINLINQAIDGLKERSIVSLSANNSSPSIYWNCPDMLNYETFTITYDNNTSETIGIADCEKTAFDVSQLGKYTVTVTYKGVSTEISINVIPRPLENCTVNPISSQEYKRTACEPELTVTYNGDTLVMDVDYTVTFRENINAGTAYADIVGIGNYAGSQSSTFRIQPLYLDENNTTTNVLEFQFYNRDTLIPDVIISYNGIDLIRGTDYEVDCYSDEYYGFADVYAYGIGNYSGWMRVDIRGDIDMDSRVTGRDLVLLQQYLNSTPEEREELWLSVEAADVNADGEVNGFDTPALREFLKTHRVSDDIRPENVDNDSNIKKVSFSSDKANIGDLISVPIIIDSNEGFNYLRLNFNYDESKLAFVNSENGEVSDNIFSNDKNIVFWNTDNDTSENGKLVTLRFKVLEESDTYDIHYKCSECYNSYRAYISPALSNEEVKSFSISDVNLDGCININDVTAIQRHLADLEVLAYEELALADTNGDGEISISDATHLQMYLAEYDVVLGKQS